MGQKRSRERYGEELHCIFQTNCHQKSMKQAIHRRNTKYQQRDKKMFNFTSNQRNANWSNVTPFFSLPSRLANSKKIDNLIILGVGKSMERRCYNKLLVRMYGILWPCDYTLEISAQVLKDAYPHGYSLQHN